MCLPYVDPKKLKGLQLLQRPVVETGSRDLFFTHFRPSEPGLRPPEKTPKEEEPSNGNTEDEESTDDGCE